MTDFSSYTTPHPNDRQQFYIASIGDQNWGGDSHLLRRGHRYHLLMYTTSGAATGKVNDDAIYAEADSIWIFPRHKTYTYSWNPEIAHWHYRWIEFDGPWAEQCLRMCQLEDKHHFHNCSACRPLVDSIVEGIYHKPDQQLHTYLGMFLSILGTIEHNYLKPRHSKQQSSTDAICKKYMADHLKNSIQLEDIAKHVQMSPFHLSRIFKQQNGIAPMKYLRQLRVARAKALFNRKDMSISEIGVAVGYPIIQHFSRMFKAETGMTPRAYIQTLH